MPRVHRLLPITMTRLAAVTMLAGSALGATAASASAAPAPSSGCADVQVMVSRGTSEPGSVGSLSAVASAITSGTTKTVSTWGNPYPASANFTSSAADGTQRLIAQMNSQASACPNQRFVLLGYSQGAMVAGDALAGSFGSSAKVSSSVGDHVAAVVLWGNPYFNSAESFDTGTYVKGVNGTYARTTGALKSYQSRMMDYCLTGDSICQSGSGGSAHTAYPRTTTVINASSNFALSKLTGSSTAPAPAPAPTVPAPAPAPTVPAPAPAPVPPTTAPAPAPAPPSGGFDFFGWFKSIFPWFP